MTDKMTDEQRARGIVGLFFFGGKGYDIASPFSDHGVERLAQRLAAALAEVRAEERERAGRIADSFQIVYESYRAPGPAHVATCIREWDDEMTAQAIRARGEK